MKLEEIIKAVRQNTINDLLGEELSNIDYSKIFLYAEYSVNVDTTYKLFKFKRGMEKIIKTQEMSYERLCSLKELTFLINHFLSQYDRKSAEILAIEIVDHLDNPNY